jgi:general nucleoside transport system permease protein
VSQLEDVERTPTARLSLYERVGGAVTPLVTTIVAFLLAGLVVLVSTGRNPLPVYRGILDGTGLPWLTHWLVDVRVIGGTRDLYPSEADAVAVSAISLQQTLILTGSLILTALAVAFAFRCGLFNIGGQGQYLVGVIVAVAVGSELTGVPRGVHVPLALFCAAVAAAVWAGIAGILRATVGAHEVITTIMLNWIAYWGGSYLFGRDGPLQNHVDKAVPISDNIAQGAHFPAIWGNPALQALHGGIFLAVAALIVFYLVLNRTTLGYEVRAVGFNPEAARYGGISVGRNFIVAMAISGLFAGLAGGLDILGWQFRLGVLDVQVTNIGYIGIAVALLGRNTAVGVGFAALLFGSLFNGVSSRSIDESIFPATLAGNLALIIQALVLLFIGADVLILYIWQARRRLRLGLNRKAAT